MKTAIYIEDGVVQLVLTPQTEFEKNALGSFEKKKLNTEIVAGSFYDCRGGWTRNGFIGHADWPQPEAKDRSLILRIGRPEHDDKAPEATRDE